LWWRLIPHPMPAGHLPFGHDHHHVAIAVSQDDAISGPTTGN